MANFVTITKEPNDYFTFVLNGDVATQIKNTRNDLLTFGDLAHFKTSNGANLIKEQNIPYGNVTIIDGATSLIPTSTDDLFTKLISVGYFDWMDGTGSGGVDRFDDLLDTFKYFGRDGQVLRVNESELKLETFVLPDISGLSVFPTPLQALKMLRVKADASGYEFVDAVNVVTQDIRSGYTETAPSEDVVYQALQNITDSVLFFPKRQFTADGVQTTFDLTTTALANMVFWNGAPLDDADWSQTSNILTLTFTPDAGAIIKPI